LKAHQCLASSLDRKKPERIMAPRMILMVGLLVYAAWEYRLRTALKSQGATFPDPKGQPAQTPTARGVLHDFVGIHRFLSRHKGQSSSMSLKSISAYLQLLGDRYAWLYR
jgi:transposase